MRIIEETQLDFCDVLIRPARSDFKSRSEVNLFRTFKRENRNTFSCIPICCANMDSISNIKTAKIFTEKGLMCAMEKHIPYEELDKLYSSLPKEQLDRIAITIGVNDSIVKLIDFNKKHKVNIICIDVANGYTVILKDKVKEVRHAFPNAWIIAGNVVTGDIVTDLINCGADIIKCGIGPGAHCRTRLQTGVGRPMISMLADCSDAAHQIKGYTMSDGGCTCPGDICKALGCSDFVMVGSMFAGAEEAANEVIEVDGEKYKKFAGMSSEYIQNKLFGGFKSQYRTSEGRQSLVKIKGSLNGIIDDILGGVRSCATYIGCHKMKHFQKHCTFYKVNHQYTKTYENAPTFK